MAHKTNSVGIICYEGEHLTADAVRDRHKQKVVDEPLNPAMIVCGPVEHLLAVIEAEVGKRPDGTQD